MLALNLKFCLVIKRLNPALGIQVLIAVLLTRLDEQLVLSLLFLYEIATDTDKTIFVPKIVDIVKNMGTLCSMCFEVIPISILFAVSLWRDIPVQCRQMPQNVGSDQGLYCLLLILDTPAGV